MGQGTLREVREMSGDPREDLGRVGGPIGGSKTGRGSLEEVLDVRRTLGEVRD